MISSGTRKYLIYETCQCGLGRSWHSATDIVPPDVYFGESEEPIALGASLHHFFQGEIHPRVAIYKMAIECLAILELDQHRMALRRSK